mgnify:CR=1 FL=1
MISTGSVIWRTHWPVNLAGRFSWKAVTRPRQSVRLIPIAAATTTGFALATVIEYLLARAQRDDVGEVAAYEVGVGHLGLRAEG